MSYFSAEKTIREDGSQSVVLVDDNYQIVEEVALFLNYLEKRGRSINTIENYCRDLKEYYTWLSKEELKFFEVSRRIMISWIDFINIEAGNKREKSARTVNRYIATIASFYNYFESIGGYLEENPISTDSNNINFKYNTKTFDKNNVNVNLYRQKERKKKNTQRLFRNEIDVLYKELSELTNNDEINERNQLIFRTLYETGCRIGEILGLRIMDYSTPNPMDKVGFIQIKRHLPLYHKDHNIKTNERDIPVSMELIYAIDEYVINMRPHNEEIETIFVSHSHSTLGNFLTRSAIEKVFQRLSNKTEINCTPHMLRHTHGTELKERGYDQIYISDRLGHSSLESTNKYMHISFEAQSEAYEKMILSRNRGVLE